jgi:hypothetical protein
MIETGLECPVISTDDVNRTLTLAQPNADGKLPPKE